VFAVNLYMQEKKKVKTGKPTFSFVIKVHKCNDVLDRTEKECVISWPRSSICKVLL